MRERLDDLDALSDDIRFIYRELEGRESRESCESCARAATVWATEGIPALAHTRAFGHPAHNPRARARGCVPCPPDGRRFQRGDVRAPIRSLAVCRTPRTV